MPAKKKVTKKKAGGKKGKSDGAADGSEQPTPPSPLQFMMDQWLFCTGRYAVPPAIALEMWRTITERYLEPQRYYHTLRHIQELLEQMKSVESELEQPLAVLLMIFFHDLVYDPQAKDNEDRSADLFRDFCKACGEGRIPVKTQELVCDAIAYTKHHTAAPMTAHKDILLFLDMDIAILGSHKERYVEYMRQIRQEYRHVPHDMFGKGRAAVLQQFLTVKRLFKTDTFYHRLEAIARENLTYEISVLTTPEVASGRITISDLPEVVQFLDANYRITNQGLSPVAMGSSLASSTNAPTANPNHNTAAAIGGVMDYALQAASSFTTASRIVPNALPDALAMLEGDIVHCITMSMDTCLAYRDDRTKRIICLVLCTKTSDDAYTLEARSNHSLVGNHVLVHAVVTQRDRRGRGLGAALFGELLGSLRDEKISMISTLCWKGTKQEVFMRKLGFTPVQDVDLSADGYQGLGEEDADEVASTTHTADEHQSDGGAGSDGADGGIASDGSFSGSPTSGAGGRRGSTSPISPVRRHASFAMGGRTERAGGGSIVGLVENSSMAAMPPSHHTASFRFERNNSMSSPATGVASGVNPFAPFGVDEQLVHKLRGRRRHAVEMRLKLN